MRSVGLRLPSFVETSSLPHSPLPPVRFGAVDHVFCWGSLLVFSSHGLISWKDIHETEIKT